ASYLDEAWETAISYRNRVSSVVRSAEKISDAPAIWRVDDCTVASDAADILIESSNGPIFIFGRDTASLRVSARAPHGSSVNLEQILKATAEACGGSGGGHQLRAGADVPLDREDEFLAGLEAASCT
ncbi:MAG: DHH family phosphoesterase, partial [Methanocorpusculum sp.]|nr:DHH family phosphoesterase [Methanocorpusculum sp.]